MECDKKGLGEQSQTSIQKWQKKNLETFPLKLHPNNKEETCSISYFVTR